MRQKQAKGSTILLNSCSTRDNRYLQAAEDGITSRLFCLYEADSYFLQDFTIWMRSHIFVYFLGYSDLSGTSHIPSMTNQVQRTEAQTAQQIFVKDNRHWHPFDEHLLQAIYSDAVQVGMPLAQAITILAQHIHHRLGSHTNMHPSNHSPPSTP